MYDLLIKGGSVVDGTGDPAFPADVAVQDGRIVRVAPDIDAPAREIIDATGSMVTPGFIDLHTHYDGQVTWDSAMLPSAAHGVTTVLTGCCGIGFAPVRKGSEDWLIRITEGVEDIPGTALHVGIPWGWESFTEYLDTLARREYALDIGVHVPHSAMRAYVLGRRAEDDAPATPEELAQMAEIVREGIAAGAVGVGTSRVAMHRGSGGHNLPGTRATETELMTIAEAIRDGGGGVFQMIPSGIAGGVEGEEGAQFFVGLEGVRDQHPIGDEIQMMRRLHRATGQTITFTFARTSGISGREFERARGMIADIAAADERIFPQFAPRSTGGIMALGAYHLFTARPSYRAIEHLPLEERARKMAEPATKVAILGEADLSSDSAEPMHNMHQTFARNLADIYDLTDLDYEPAKSRSILAMAEANGRDPLEFAYDRLIANDGNAVLVWFTNYVGGDLDVIAEFIADRRYIMGLGDGGAHVQFVCDASFPTFLLSFWGKNRTRGRTFPIELLVRRLTGDPAMLYRLDDRGRIAEGLRADINVIDPGRLGITRPRTVFDLPTDAMRFMQDATGYRATIVNGVVTRRDDKATGALPGRLLRRNQNPPAVRSPERELSGTAITA